MTTTLNRLSIILAVLGFSLLFSCSEDNGINETPLPETEATVEIAKWQGNKKAAITLQFDDSTPGQATLGVPALIKRNIIGTWYVNPGSSVFNEYLNEWKEAVSGEQEIANHTMTHTGAATYEETVYEVGEAAKIIWNLRGEDDFASLMAFNRGGGTSWNEDDLEAVLEEYKNIDRQSYVGIKVLAKSVSPGSDAEQMYEIVPTVINEGIIGRVHFHGIASENGSPPYDYGNGAVWIKEFETFLDKLVAIEDEVWIGGYIEVYKYIKEKNTAKAKITQYTNNSFSIELTSGMDDNYYNEPLTLIVDLPFEWETCIIIQNEKEEIVTLTGKQLIFNAAPGSEKIWLKEKK